MQSTRCGLVWACVELGLFGCGGAVEGGHGPGLDATDDEGDTRGGPRSFADSVSPAAAAEPEAEPAPETEPDPEIEVCGERLTPGELGELLDGTLVIAARHHRYGLTPAQAAVGFALELALNGIDFGSLGNGALEFEDGAYVFRNGDAVIGIRLVLTEDVGSLEAGTALTHELFAPASFFTGLDVEVEASLSLSDPELRFHADFQPGPLFDLVEGSIHFDGVLPTDASLRLRTDVIAVEVVTRQSYAFAAPYDADELTVVMNTTPVPLADLHSALRDEGIGLVMTGSHAYSERHGLDQVFTDATFMMQELEGDRWAVSGPYAALASYGDLLLYHSGRVDTVSGNTTDVYCDEARTVLVGHAEHDLDLSGGIFRHVSGRSFDYSLVEVPSAEARVRED